MDKNQALQALIGHIKASRDAGTPDSAAEQAYSKYQSVNPATQTDVDQTGSSDRSATGNTVPVAQQLSKQDLSNSDSGMLAKQMGNLSPTPQVNQSDPNGMDINSILQRLQPTIGQSIGNAMSVLGGGKPIYDPNMPNEFLKQGGALKYAMAPYQQQKIGSEIDKNQASTGLINTKQQYVAPQAQAGIAQKQAAAGMDIAKTTGMQRANNLVEEALSGKGNPNGPNLQVSGITTGGSRGASINMKNMTELGQEGAIRSNVKGMENQDAKVSSSIHALQIFEQGYDPSTNTFTIDPSQYKELAMNIANTIAQSGAGTGEDRNAIAQRTAAGDYLGVLQYVSGAPQNASSQEIFQRLYMSLKRQGGTSERLRSGYAQNMGVDSGNVGNSFNQELQNSPMGQGQGQGNDQIVRTGTDKSTNKRVGMTKDGRVIPLG